MENMQITDDFLSSFSNTKIELKSINKVPYFCVPINENLEGSSPVPQFDMTKDYNLECMNLQEANEELVTKIEFLGKEIREIRELIMKIDKTASQGKSKKYIINKKRDRRKSSQIPRMFSCEICKKSYG
jgi:glycosylphosphatidylinositol transamidase (GPIT) subunit GPI8